MVGTIVGAEKSHNRGVGLVIRGGALVPLFFTPYRGVEQNDDRAEGDRRLSLDAFAPKPGTMKLFGSATWPSDLVMLVRSANDEPSGRARRGVAAVCLYSTAPASIPCLSELLSSMCSFVAPLN